jgi:phosphoribosylformimino-5-aminoimidazole carboxamide ribotide isomerase
LVQLIDLDAARGQGDNRDLIRSMLGRMKCQVGGGVRTVADAQRHIEHGAARVIIGSSLVREGRIDVDHARNLSESVGTEKLVFAVDSRAGTVAIAGWREKTGLTAVRMIELLDRFCDAFLYTHIDTEGSMQGIPMETVRTVSRATQRRLIVAGGIRSREEVDQLDALGIDAVVGMAVYTGRIRA